MPTIIIAGRSHIFTVCERARLKCDKYSSENVFRFLHCGGRIVLSVGLRYAQITPDMSRPWFPTLIHNMPFNDTCTSSTLPLSTRTCLECSSIIQADTRKQALYLLD